ncbi:CheR family methyltransferase [Maridesulfovibrio sp.]|uniref:CheR family methyltransferase n=1 Tax=Maridesulfovibrio sp. TaxID=2795000 RepID=UPI002A18DB7E|nr:CheR family methyltransferase [Maridesulfovibrio sp.]
MINFLTDDRVSELADMVRNRFGLNFSSERWKDLRSAVVRFQREDSSFRTPAECLEYILSPNVGNNDLEQFINRLTIGETFFFRDTNALMVLEYEILRKLRDRGSGLNGAARIWSAACSTGEEPYTIAMICRRSGISAEIFGTDIDSKALIKAREGCYRKWSFRSEDTGFRDIFFRKVGSNSFILDSSIKRMVNLSRLNLMDASVPVTLQDMDVIFCRNVLMYFSSEGVRSVLDKLWNCLTPGGWLVATPSESGLLSSHGRFEPVNVGGVLLFRKTENYVPECQMGFDGFKFRGDSEIPVSSAAEQFDFNAQLESTPVDSDDFLFAEPEIPVHEVDSVLEPPVLPRAGNDGAALLKQAEQVWMQGDTFKAVSLYKEVVEHENPREIKAAAFLGIARIKADSGLADEAARWCVKALELDRVSPCAHFLLGQICFQQGDLGTALAHMRNAVFLDSEFIMAHFLLGNIYLEKNDSNGALRHFRISVQELEKMDQDESVPCSDNVTAGRLMEMVHLVQQQLVK